MDLGISGRNFLVTAASKGLGFSVARELLREGARVMISSSSDENLRAAVDRLRQEGLETVTAMRADLVNEEDIARLTDHALEVFGGEIHGLVTNCGGPPAGPPLTITDGQWQTAFDSVFLSVVRLCRRLLPSMIERRDGSVLAITSTSAKQPIPNLTTSNSMRPAVVGFLKYLSNEVAPHNVRINVVAPGRVLTERTAELNQSLVERTGKSLEEVQAEYTAEIPMGRIADLDEFPALCAFLLSSRASYITGQTICSDGGRVATIW